MFTRDIDITSPKRIGRSDNAWEGFFPYYAGFPESFASRILSTSGLSPESVIFDPWNGSGTTTYAAAKLGFSTVGFDINPAMVVVGKARLLPGNEADSLVPLAKRILLSSHGRRHEISPNEPLLIWFGPETAQNIRCIEESIRCHLVGPSTISDQGVALEFLSGIAAAFYVALFSVCRSACLKFRSSNPTWFRHPKIGERRISMTKSNLEKTFLLEMPVPPVFVIEEEDGTYQLIDGLQRFSSYLHLRGKLNTPDLPNPVALGQMLKLSECDIVKELNGLTFDDFPTSLQIRIKRAFIRMEIIRKETDSRFKYHMFIRRT